MLTHDELKAKALRDPHVRAEYKALEAEFTWLAELLQARNRAGLTQTEVAERMGTTPSAVARLEAGGGRQKHSPSIATLRKYAEAVGCMVEVKLVPCTQPAPAAAVSQRKSRGRAGSGRGEQTKGTSSRSSAGRPGPNTYEDTLCQETDYPEERFFAFCRFPGPGVVDRRSHGLT